MAPCPPIDPPLNRPELNSTDYKIYGVYRSVNMSCKSTKLKKSGRDWLQHLSEKMRFSCFCEALLG